MTDLIEKWGLSGSSLRNYLPFRQITTSNHLPRHMLLLQCYTGRLNAYWISICVEHKSLVVNLYFALRELALYSPKYAPLYFPSDTTAIRPSWTIGSNFLFTCLQAGAIVNRRIACHFPILHRSVKRRREHAFEREERAMMDSLLCKEKECLTRIIDCHWAIIHRMI